MKLTFSPASPFARKVRIAAIELGLIDKIEFVPAAVAPGTANDEYSAHHAAEEAAGADPRTMATSFWIPTSSSNISTNSPAAAS